MGVISHNLRNVVELGVVEFHIWIDMERLQCITILVLNCENTILLLVSPALVLIMDPHGSDIWEAICYKKKSGRFISSKRYWFRGIPPPCCDKHLQIRGGGGGGGGCFVDQWSPGSYVVEVFIRSWLRHPTTVSSMWTLPQIVKIKNGTKCNAIRKSPSGSIIIGSMPLLIMRSPPT